MNISKVRKFDTLTINVEGKIIGRSARYFKGKKSYEHPGNNEDSQRSGGRYENLCYGQLSRHNHH